MKKIGFKKNIVKFAAVASLSLLVLAVAGCGGSGEKKAEAPKDAKTYVVATRGTFRPFTYVDDKNQLTGFDVEVIKEIDKRNPNIKFNFKTMSVSAAFMAMESNQVDVVANQITYNEKRAAKTIYTKEVNNYTARKFAVKDDRNDINSIDDLRGKKVATVTTSEITRQLQEFNKTADPKIEFVFSDKGATELLNLVATGRVDAAPVYEVTITDAQKVLGLKVKPAGPVVASDPTHFALKKDDEHQKLADQIDKTLKEMRADGTLKKLSEQFLGKDYTVPQK